LTLRLGEARQAVVDQFQGCLDGALLLLQFFVHGSPLSGSKLIDFDVPEIGVVHSIPPPSGTRPAVDMVLHFGCKLKGRDVRRRQRTKNLTAYGVFSASHTGPGGPVPASGKSMKIDYGYVMQFAEMGP